MFSYFIVVYCFVVVSSPLPHPVVAIPPTVSAIVVVVVVAAAFVVVVVLVVAIYHPLSP
jgi:hypothetical protein